MTGLTRDITSVAVIEHSVLRLTFADGLTAEFDVLDRMRGPAFTDARTPARFALITVDPETARWSGGEPP